MASQRWHEKDRGVSDASLPRLESIVTSPNDERPTRPGDEWPIRPDPKRGDESKTTLPRIYVAPDETEETDNSTSQPVKRRSRKQTVKICSVFVGVVTLVFGFVYITDTFDGNELWVGGLYAFIIFMGLLDILTEDESEGEGNDPAYKKALKEAIPRRAVISDDEPPIIPIPRTTDGTGPTDDPKPTGTSDHDNDVWPVLPQKEEPKPKFDLYVPDEQSETHDKYLPHLPLPEKPTIYERIRRISWLTGFYLLFTLLLSVIIGFANPEESGFPEIQIFFGIICGFSFVIAYSEQLFIGGDH
jgi:hypothetical protein